MSIFAPGNTELSSESNSPLEVGNDAEGSRENEEEEEEEERMGTFNTMLDSLSVNRNAPSTSNKKNSVTDSTSLETARDNRTNTVYDAHEDSSLLRSGGGMSVTSEMPPDFYTRRAEDIYYDPDRVRKVKFLDPVVSGSTPAKVFQRS